MLLLLVKLFVSFFQVGLFTIGGGYAALPLIHNQVVTVNSWLTATEMADVIASRACAEFMPLNEPESTSTPSSSKAWVSGSALGAEADAPSGLMTILMGRWYFWANSKSL